MAYINELLDEFDKNHEGNESDYSFEDETSKHVNDFSFFKMGNHQRPAQDLTLDSDNDDDNTASLDQ